MLQYQIYWEGRYRNGRVACLDYTQLQEHAASEARKRWTQPACGNPPALLLH
jgi:hypothetical protein